MVKMERMTLLNIALQWLVFKQLFKVYGLKYDSILTAICDGIYQLSTCYLKDQ